MARIVNQKGGPAENCFSLAAAGAVKIEVAWLWRFRMVSEIEKVRKDDGEISRRDFLKDTGAIVGGATVTARAPLAAGTASAETAAGVPEPVKLTVLDPTGAQEITHVFAARLQDLNGKLIAELAVDPSKWQPHRTMPYIEKLMKKQFPAVRFIPMQEFPMGLQISDDKVVTMVAARKPDAVIVGNAG
jgi:hypothetical protein